MDDLGLDLRDGYRRLRLVVRGQPLPSAESEWDRDVLDTMVEADTGVFRGSFKTTVWAHELANVRSLLQALLNQLGQHLNASFAFLEHGVTLNIELLRRGAFTVQITLQPDTGGIEQLIFELDLDPTQVTACLHQLNAVLSRFPPAVTSNYAPESDISHPAS